MVESIQTKLGFTHPEYRRDLPSVHLPVQWVPLLTCPLTALWSFKVLPALCLLSALGCFSSPLMGMKTQAPDKRLANSGPVVKSSPPLILLNKVLFEHNLPIYLYIYWSVFAL
jgi:hypothetical protein